MTDNFDHLTDCSIDPIKVAIADNRILVLVMPRDEFEGSRSHSYVDWAMLLDRHIILWRPEGLTDLPIPQAILDYDNSSIVDGEHQHCTEAVLRYMAEFPSLGAVIYDGGWMETAAHLVDGIQS